MKDDIKTYSTKEVAKRLLVEPVTVRKYTQMLEEKGYNFKKDSKGWRFFTEEDIKALEYLSYLKVQGSSLEDAMEHVASLYRANLSIAQPDMSIQEDPMSEFIKQQTAFNEALLKRLEEQQQYIENSLKKRDEMLVHALKETLETKLLIAAAEKESPPKWWQFWKRKN